MVLLLFLGCKPNPDTCTAPANVRDEATSEALAASSGVNGLGLDLLESRTDTNPFLAPLSISAALAFVLAGAVGDTLTELESVLGVTDDASYHQGLADIEAALESASGDPDADCPTWSFAGGAAAFLDESLEPTDSWLATMADPYGVAPRTVDFADPTSAASSISAWASEATLGRIEDMVQPEQIDPTYTIFMLATAVVFDAKWENPFDEADTTSRPFTRAGGSNVDTPMMTSTSDVRLIGVSGGLVGEIPYRGQDVGMVLIVPDDYNGLPDLLASLDLDQLGRNLDDASYSEVEVRMPVFELESRASLNAPLQALGMLTAFDEQEADLSALAPPPVGFDNIYVSDVVHDAWIQVDESGTKAAAVTTVEGSVTDSAEPLPSTLYADRPFVYAIRDRVTGVWLFAGRMDEPPVDGEPASR